jgi:hypothetical protein
MRNFEQRFFVGLRRLKVNVTRLKEGYNKKCTPSVGSAFLKHFECQIFM